MLRISRGFNGDRLKVVFRIPSGSSRFVKLDEDKKIDAFNLMNAICASRSSSDVEKL